MLKKLDSIKAFLFEVCFTCGNPWSEKTTYVFEAQH